MSRRKTINRGGRPSKFTTAAVVKITSELLDGQSFEDAARAAGIGPVTLYRWLAKAKAGDPRFGPMNEVIKQAKQARDLDAAFGYFLPKLLKDGF